MFLKLQRGASDTAYYFTALTADRAFPKLFLIFLHISRSLGQIKCRLELQGSRDETLTRQFPDKGFVDKYKC